jgi:hypothetical protein
MTGITISAARNPDRSSHCPYRSRLLTKSPVFEFGDATDSAGAS